MLANVLAVAAAAQLPARLVLGFADDAVNRLLDLDTQREVTLSLVPLGANGPTPPPSPPIAPLGLETLPLSPREIDYPAMRQMHEASSLTSPEQVVAWRELSAKAPFDKLTVSGLKSEGGSAH